MLPWNERYSDEHVDYIGRSIRQAAWNLATQGD